MGEAILEYFAGNDDIYLKKSKICKILKDHGNRKVNKILENNEKWYNSC